LTFDEEYARAKFTGQGAEYTASRLDGPDPYQSIKGVIPPGQIQFY
jgi:hypothetical protein